MVRTLLPPASFQEKAAHQKLTLVRADYFSLQQLTDAYNQTRIDYIVPMPMNVTRLKDYIKLYDIDLSVSWVAMRGETIFGLGMLGLREKRAWITRIGVLPHGRRQGTGRAITNRLIRSAEDCGAETIWLEVIKGNEPARQLFLTSGFLQTRELVVARRAPKHTAPLDEGCSGRETAREIRDLTFSELCTVMANRKSRPNWLNELESLQNTVDLNASLVTLDNGEIGLVTYRASKMQLDHVLVETIQGDPATVTASVLKILHKRYITQDATMENLPLSHPTWIGFVDAGYFEVFRRIEMVKEGPHLLPS